MSKVYDYAYRKAITDKNLDTESKLCIIGSCIESGTNVNHEPAALIEAIKTNDCILVKLLLESGINVNYAKPTAFLEAFKVENYYSMVKLLLEFGADIHYGENTILLEAIILTRDHLLVKLLLDNGIDPTTDDNIGICAVFFEDPNNSIESFVPNMNILELLVEHGAYPTSCDSHELCLACNYNHLDPIKFLVGLGADHLARNNKPMFNACAHHNLSVVQYLANLGASCTEPDNQPIWSAFNKSGGTEVKKFLLEAGANPNSISYWDGTCLLDLAVEKNDLEDCELLFAHGADVTLCVIHTRKKLYNFPDEYLERNFIDLFMSHGLDISEYFEKIKLLPTPDFSYQNDIDMSRISIN